MISRNGSKRLKAAQNFSKQDFEFIYTNVIFGDYRCLLCNVQNIGGNSFEEYFLASQKLMPRLLKVCPGSNAPTFEKFAPTRMPRFGAKLVGEKKNTLVRPVVTDVEKK